MHGRAPLQFETIPVATPPDGPLAVELVPAPGPWEVALHLAHLPGLLFLDSAEKHPDRGRYSYISASPGFHPRVRGSRPGQHVLAPLQADLDSRRLATILDLPPFQGGVAGVLGYGLGHAFEKLPHSPFDEFGFPDVATATYDWVLSFDHEQERAWLVSSGFPAREGRARAAMNRLREVAGLLRKPFQSWGAIPPSGPPISLCPQYPLPGFPGVTSNFDRGGYETAVRRVVDYIHAGDCFQVNLSQRLLAPLHSHPLELYGRLRELNPAPFGGYIDLGDFQVLSASPERFLRLSRGEVETRPIKGTRPRGGTREEDAAMRRDLAANPKDRAENVMIVDLLRNDIGKVCEYGSVRVPRVCEVESFRYVHHLVSEVRGKLRDGLGFLDLLAAAFPGGSVTGAPKVRSMEIIAELEPTARGAYCGCLGWIGFDGSADTNILIRTFTTGRGWVQFPVGGGIVADSGPAREYEETLHKAAGLLQALRSPGST
jgi:para-aminobenzoate synthetase component 1